MQILVHSDRNLAGGESLRDSVESIVHSELDRFASRITRIEVHVSDSNGPKHGAREKHCVMEAHIGGVRPIAVTNEAPNTASAIEGAAQKLARAIAHTLARMQDTRGPSPREADIASVDELQNLEPKKR
ncbi:MAG TPA: HPF/RaiA family ribosome-associated protein [Steroidobacteraceae bacterium]